MRVCVGHARGAGVPAYLPRARRLCRFCAPLWEHNRNTIRHNRRRQTGYSAAARASKACTDAIGRVRVRVGNAKLAGVPSFLPRARRLCRICTIVGTQYGTTGAAGRGKRRQRALARHARTPLGVCACVGHARGAGVPSYLPRARRLCRFCAPLWEHNRNTYTAQLAAPDGVNGVSARY